MKEGLAWQRVPVYTYTEKLDGSRLSKPRQAHMDMDRFNEPRSYRRDLQAREDLNMSQVAHYSWHLGNVR